jgi:uncharacterized protein (UPF0332 family)
LSTWKAMSLDSLRAAKSLAASRRWRSSVSRAYYAAYCAVAGELVGKGIQFPHGWQNPGHEQLPDLVEHNLTLPQETKRRLKKALRLLRRAREDADYRPSVSVDRSLTLDCLRVVIAALKLLGIDDEG